MTLSEDLEGFWRDQGTLHALSRWIRSGLDEDRVGDDRATSSLFPAGAGPVDAILTAVEPGVLAGGPAAVACFREMDPEVVERRRVLDGTEVTPGQVVLEVRASVAAVLGAERTALNLFSHLSGIATRVREWTREAPGLEVLDTRKTLPGIRRFQKYAVRCGGGVNHRMDLAEFPMIKENHRKLFRDQFLPQGATASEEIATIAGKLRAAGPVGPLEVEVEDRESFFACLEHGVDLVLLDNQTPETIAEWIGDARGQGGAIAAALDRTALEASGGITNEGLAAYAACGVSRISLGALTHSVKALDLSLHVQWGRETA